MKLLFVFCCLSAGCILWTEASPFLFGLQNSIQIQRQPAVRQQGFNFGYGGIISKWFPSIVINKQFGTRRPKATQRPVIEVTTVFVPSEDLDKEVGTTTTSTTSLPAEVIDIFTETSSGSSENPFVEEIEESSSSTSTSTSTTTTTTEEPSEEVDNIKEEGTTSTTTPVPFEEIEPFTESKTSTTTTELPFEETEPENNSSSNEESELSNDIKTSTTTSTTTTTEAPYQETEDNNENEASQNVSEGELSSTTTTSTTTTQSPFEGDSGSSSTSDSNAESLINSIGFTTESSSTSTSTEVNQPSIDYLPSGSDNEEVAAIKPTTYRPLYVPTTTTTTTTNAPWIETPANIVNTGGFVDANKPIQSYVYVRPEVSVDDILLNEVSPKARPFESISLVGTTSNGKRVERTYQPLPQPLGVINERPRVTFYSNY